MSTMNKTTSVAKHHHHSSNKSGFQKFCANAQKTAMNVATNPCTYIGGGIAAAIAVPVTCEVQKKVWLKAAEEFDALTDGQYK